MIGADLESAVARMKARNYNFPVRKELEYLPGHLMPEERVLDVLSGRHASHIGLAALTDSRLIFIEAKLVGAGETYFESIERSDIGGVHLTKSWRDRSLLLVRRSRPAWKLEDVVEADAQRIVDRLTA